MVFDPFDVLGTTAVQCMLSGRGCVSFDQAPAGIGQNYIFDQAEALFQTSQPRSLLFTPVDREAELDAAKSFGVVTAVNDIPECILPLFPLDGDVSKKMDKYVFLSIFSCHPL